MRRLLLALTLAIGAAVAPAGRAAPGPDSPLCIPRTAPVSIGLQLLRTAPVAGHPRTQRLTFRSAAMQREVHVLVTLPVGYSAKSRTRYPMLLLLHGHGGNETTWIDNGADATLAKQPWVVVTPDGGTGGWYSDWYGRDVLGGTSDPAPAWESFHIRELLPWVDAHYRTVGKREGRAVAGLSMGGFGATSYAARHPDLFAAVAGFSGAVDNTYRHPGGSALVVPFSNLPGGPLDSCIWGDPVTQEVRYRDHNPVELAANLRGMDVTLMTGNGLPGGAHDGAAYNPQSAFVEFFCGQMNEGFDAALTAAGVAHATRFYGAGTHEWGYWIEDLSIWAPTVAQVFARPRPVTTFDFATAEASFERFGWSFTTHRDVVEFLYLTGVGPQGLALSGSGPVDVVTPPIYRPGSRIRLSADGGTAPETVLVGRDRRARFTVDLGAVHPTQQYVFQPAARSSWAKAVVRIGA